MAPKIAAIASTAEMTAFQPAKDRPKKRKDASVQETMRILSSWPRRSPVVVTPPAPPVPQSVGPAHQPHSAPA